MDLPRNSGNSPVSGFHRRLHQWYRMSGRRNLPWRNTDDAYAIYISEIMLQQTQVGTVLERFYFPFLERFPSLKALANADREDVLSAWQGLGYYSRAGNLHAAAKQCRGTLPDSVDELIALPGIGRNTAHALAAFAYHQPVAVMEANVKRVLSRIFALKHPKEPELWEKAAALLDAKEPFDYNQAMMDLGATVCTRRAPRCGECPASGICRGKEAAESYPAKIQKKAPPVRNKHITVLRNARGQYYATPRESRFLQGLYHFVESEKKPPHAQKLGSIRQQYSHFTLEADVFLRETSGKGDMWHSRSQLARLPFSMAEKKILALLAEA